MKLNPDCVLNDYYCNILQKKLSLSTRHMYRLLQVTQTTRTQDFLNFKTDVGDKDHFSSVDSVSVLIEDMH